jgi:hypothetical protein
MIQEHIFWAIRVIHYLFFFHKKLKTLCSGKRRKRQLANDGLLPIEDNEYSAGGGGNSAALDLLESLADAWNGGPSAGSVLAGSFAADDGSTSETMANADPALKYPWNRYKQSGRQQQQADISRASLTAAQQASLTLIILHTSSDRKNLSCLLRIYHENLDPFDSFLISYSRELE